MDEANRSGIYEGTKPYVFISYSHKNTKAMLQVKELFDSKGIRYWYDYGLHSGDDWYKSIAVHLKNSVACIVLISPESVESEYVKNELHYANSNKIPIHILMLESFTLPEDIAMMTGRIQRISISSDYEYKLIKALPQEVFKELPPVSPDDKKKRYRKILKSMSEEMIVDDKVNPDSTLWKILKPIFKLLKGTVKFFLGFFIVIMIFTLACALIGTFYPTEPVTAAEAPCFAEYASLEPCKKHAEDGQLYYESILPKNPDSSHDYAVVDEYIKMLTSSYSFNKLGEKTFYDAIYTVWYWFEYTGDEEVTDRTSKLFDGTEMKEHHLSILLHEQENDVIIRVFTAPEIKEVESKKVFKDKQ